MDLDSPISKLPFVGRIHLRRLENLGIYKIEDLFYHIPNRYVDYRIVSPIGSVQIGESLTVQAVVTSIKNIYTTRGKKIQIAEIQDETGKMNVVWFNQPFLVKSIKRGERYSFSGRVDWFDRKKSFISPEYENIENSDKTVHTGRLVPIYPETYGISSKWLRSKIDKAFSLVEDKLEEFLPETTLTKLSLPEYKQAIKFVHYPQKIEDTEIGRKRLALNEFLFLYLKNLYRKEDWKKLRVVHKLKINKKMYNDFLEILPFKLTISQEQAIKEIFSDLSKDQPMNRLLEGDVGSGKTVVAAAACFASFVNGYQSVIMAPTQILAQQHFDTLKEILSPFKVRVALITSEGIKSDLGKIDIFVGTHALIHKRVDFENVAFVAIDEQHRFGVEQRAHLVQKSAKSSGRNKAPHVLTMTATPIPRTVALTMYGDLDLSVLKELPKGRQPITTWLVPSEKKEAAYQWVRKEIKEKGVQAFVICPLIEESIKESMQQVKAATIEFERIKKILPDLNIGLIHGRLKTKEKNEVLDLFRDNKINLLVATPVVEVGIDIPNATIMIIEGAERFGLAQLHQLRGRVGRGKQKSYCLLFTESRAKTVVTRLNALKKTASGFELAELDLKLRGPGEIFGLRQHGFPKLKAASWADSDLIKIAKEVAQEALSKKSEFRNLLQKIKNTEVIAN